MPRPFADWSVTILSAVPGFPMPARVTSRLSFDRRIFPLGSLGVSILQLLICVVWARYYACFVFADLGLSPGSPPLGSPRRRCSHGDPRRYRRALGRQALIDECLFQICILDTTHPARRGSIFTFDQFPKAFQAFFDVPGWNAQDIASNFYKAVRLIFHYHRQASGVCAQRLKRDGPAIRGGR